VTSPLLAPDAQQARVLEHRDGALLVVGGAGSGKTAVLRERFARLLEDGADPERVALVVGSSRAKDEARAALLRRLPASLPGLHVVTVHGLANRILRERHGALGYDEPPQLLSNTEQFAKVQELLAAEDPTDWPAYGALLSLRGFADELRQFLLRAQESLVTPEDIVDAAERRGLTGWPELARFLRNYQAVIDGLNIADFAALLQRAAHAVAAGAGEPLFEHLLVDDYHDSTIAAEAIIRGLGARDLVVAANPDAHVFSFQGTTRIPLDRFAEAFPGSETVALDARHRAPEPARIQAWVAPHTSDEHASIARELRRLHVEDEVPWSELAVVVRRQGAHLGGLLRALDDARVPRTVPERGLSLTAEPATLPYVLALRWLAADRSQREELVEQLLTSEVVGLSPAAARGLLRAARALRGSIAEALELEEGLSPEEAALVREARETLDSAALFAGMSAQDAFRTLWERLPCSTRLVERAEASAEARRELDTVVTFSEVVAASSEGGDASVQSFLEELDAGRQGPGYSPFERPDLDAVRVLTAHGTAGQEFDTVIVAGAVEGNFPSLARPEPMFDLEVLERPVTRAERMRDRLADERRLFDLVLGRARRNVVLVCSDTHPDELSTRTRFAAERDIGWAPAPEGPFDEPVSVREASAAWRRRLADPAAPPGDRLAAIQGLVDLAVDPSRWWFQREWTDPGRPIHETLRVSYSRLNTLDNCELQHVLADELGLGRPAGYHAWVGKTVHEIIERCENGELEKSKETVVAELDERWRKADRMGVFPSMAVSVAFRKLAEERMLKNWFLNYAEHPALASERWFEFDFEGATIVGVIDRIGSILSGGTRITDFKTGNPATGKAEENLQLGIYYLAVQESDDLAEFRPVRAVELAFVKGNWRTGELQVAAWQVNHRSEEPYQARVRAELSRLIAEKRRLIETDVYRPNPTADCHWCDFRTLCPLFPEGQPLFPVEAVPA
jgi:superfamily I DNA/RNA helicase/RecB family exonuclease